MVYWSIFLEFLFVKKRKVSYEGDAFIWVWRSNLEGIGKLGSLVILRVFVFWGVEVYFWEFRVIEERVYVYEVFCSFIIRGGDRG